MCVCFQVSLSWYSAMPFYEFSSLLLIYCEFHKFEDTYCILSFIYLETRSARPKLGNRTSADSFFFNCSPVLLRYDIMSLILPDVLMIWLSLPSYPTTDRIKPSEGMGLMDKSRRQLSSNVMLGSFCCYRHRLLLLKYLISRSSPHWSLDEL